MGKASRDKGCRFERAIVNVLKAEGIEAKRVPLSGAAEGYKGDIETIIRGNRWVLELKSRGEGFKSLYGWLEGNDALVVKADRQKALVVLELDKFIGLVKEG